MTRKRTITDSYPFLAFVTYSCVSESYYSLGAHIMPMYTMKNDATPKPKARSVMFYRLVYRNYHSTLHPYSDGPGDLGNSDS